MSINDVPACGYALSAFYQEQASCAQATQADKESCTCTATDPDSIQYYCQTIDPSAWRSIYDRGVSARASACQAAGLDVPEAHIVALPSGMANPASEYPSLVPTFSYPVTSFNPYPTYTINTYPTTAANPYPTTSYNPYPTTSNNVYPTTVKPYPPTTYNQYPATVNPYPNQTPTTSTLVTGYIFGNNNQNAGRPYSGAVAFRSHNALAVFAIVIAFMN